MLTKTPKVLMWFRHDLRLNDNPAFSKACDSGIVIPIFILDKREALGEVTKIWLNRALVALDRELFGNLRIYEGYSEDIINNLCRDNKIDKIYANVVHTPLYADLDKKIKLNLCFTTFFASLLYDPTSVLTKDGNPYKVYTRFKNACLERSTRDISPKPTVMNLECSITCSNYHFHSKCSIDIDSWDVSEAGATVLLERFLENHLNGYKEGRNYPAKSHVSKLSPYLRHGQISPHQILEKMKIIKDSADKVHFISELIWREFSYYLLYYYPNLRTENFNKVFDNFRWGYDKEKFEAWKLGMTGYPMVDAGMRELAKTGYMNNRARLVTASFLVKNLNIHWKYGAEWFWEMLIDADPANNFASWQWVAGSGADAAPYFRIFNPTLQGEKFDPIGEYVKQFVPELANVSYKDLYSPENLKGYNYPQPIVDCKVTRDQALDQYFNIMGKKL